MLNTLVQHAQHFVVIVVVVVCFAFLYFLTALQRLPCSLLLEIKRQLAFCCVFATVTIAKVAEVAQVLPSVLLFIDYYNYFFYLFLIYFVGSVVEWLERRNCDRHGLGSKLICAILLCKLSTLGWEVLKVFKRGLKLVQYCKTCQTYIDDSEIIKGAKKLTLTNYSPNSFRIAYQGLL